MYGPKGSIHLHSNYTKRGLLGSWLFKMGFPHVRMGGTKFLFLRNYLIDAPTVVFLQSRPTTSTTFLRPLSLDPPAPVGSASPPTVFQKIATQLLLYDLTQSNALLLISQRLIAYTQNQLFRAVKKTFKNLRLQASFLGHTLPEKNEAVYFKRGEKRAFTDS